MNMLQEKAVLFVKNSSFFKEMEKFGEVIFTGSYALDTMTWPDLDVQLKLTPSHTALQALVHLSQILLQTPTTIRFQYVNFKQYPRETLPKGLSVGAQISDPALKGLN